MRLRKCSWRKPPGTNSLLDLVVFGRRVGLHVAKNVDSIQLQKLPLDAGSWLEGEIKRLKDNPGKERHGELQKSCRSHDDRRRCDSNRRNPHRAKTKVLELRERYNCGIDDKGQVLTGPARNHRTWLHD